MKTKLWNHQEQAVEYAQSKGAVLWHMGMGTGKTLSALTFIERVDASKTIIVCPAAVIDVWPYQAEIHGFDGIVVPLNKGNVANKVEIAKTQMKICEIQQQRIVLVINYESIWREPFARFVRMNRWDCMLLDEAHRIKAPGSKVSLFFGKCTYDACHGKLTGISKYRLALTGTPMAQSPLDIYGIYRFLNPKVFGTSFQRFRARYAIMGGYENKQVVAYTNTQEFGERVDLLRYHASRDVLDLPDAVHTERRFDMPTKAQKIYAELENNFYTELESGEVSVDNALSKLLRLQQVTSGFLPVDKNIVENLHDAKLNQLLEIFDELPDHEPVVVFARFRHDLQMIHRAAVKANRISSELSGSENTLKDWQSGKTNVLAVQIQSGSEGVDFTRAAHVVFYSLGFSLTQYKQALARTHRPGQDRTCFFHHLIANKTVDVKVYKAIERNQEIIDSIIGIKATIAA